MRPRCRPEFRSRCPANVALEYVGDPWSLLIVRDLMFRNASRFADFLRADERIATNVLTQRLARLEASGIVTKQADPLDGRRYLYSLTEKGIDLAPVIAELVLWASKYEKTDASQSEITALRADRDAFLAQVRRRWEESQRTSGFPPLKRTTGQSR